MEDIAGSLTLNGDYGVGFLGHVSIVIMQLLLHMMRRFWACKDGWEEVNCV